MNNHGEILKHYQDTKESKVIFSFKGRFSQEILTELGSMIRTSLQAESKIKKIFGVFVELSQNILYYSEERDVGPTGDDGGVGIVLFKEIGEGYILGSGNLVKTERAKTIQEKISHVNSLDKDKLREFYQKQLRQDRPEDSKGAGVGLIDIARKSDGQLGFHISEVDSIFSFMTITVSFKKDI
ncbi:MAG: SiaB family protein kinase [Leptospiraceae bacterium]|nr:SiaB family protein kinase [Leptospiraceae bacterium]